MKLSYNCNIFSALTFCHRTSSWCALGKITPRPPSLPQLAIILCVQLKPHGFFYVHFGLFLVSFSSHLGSHVCETLWEYFLILIRDISWQTPRSSVSNSFPFLFPSTHAMVPKTWIWDRFVNVTVGTGFHMSGLLVVFCNGFCLYKRKYSWWRVKTPLTCGYKQIFTGYYLGLFWFKLVVSITSHGFPLVEQDTSPFG